MDTQTHTKDFFPSLTSFWSMKYYRSTATSTPPPLDGTTREGGYHIKLMGMPLVSLRHRIWRFWSPLRVLHTSKDRRPINVSLWVVSNKIHCTQVVDPGEGPGGPRPPLFLDQNEARRAEKKLFWGWAPTLSQGMDDCPPPPPLIWRSGSATVSL